MVVVWVDHEILVSAQGPLFLGFGFLALGLWGLVPGLDNYESFDLIYTQGYLGLIAKGFIST